MAFVKGKDGDGTPWYAFTVGGTGAASNSPATPVHAIADATGAVINNANPFPVSVQSLPTVNAAQTGVWTVAITGVALDATLTAGLAKVIARGGQKGATAANADITHTAEGADHEAIDVQLYHGGVAKDPTAIRALTSADIVSAAQSGVWNIVVNNAFALDATLTSGLAKTIARGGQKGATANNADITHTAEGADHEAIDVQLYHGGNTVNPTAIRALTSADVVSAVQSGVWTVAVTGVALDATLTAGSAKVIARGGQKGATAANADITHTAEGADHEAFDVQIYHGGVAKDPTAVRALTSADVVSAAQSGVWTVAVTGVALDATLTGGLQKTIARGGQKGATAANADITHTAEGADHEAIDVQLYHGGVAKDPTNIRALTAADVVALGAGSLIVGKFTTDQTTHGTSDLVASDLTKVNGAVVPIGNGVNTNGVQRVAIISDQTGYTVNIGTDVVAAVVSGAKSSIGNTALQLVAANTLATKGVVVKAAAANAGRVYVGPSTVTANTADATDGVELAAGESVLIPVNNANVLYVISNTTAQKVFWAAC